MRRVEGKGVIVTRALALAFGGRGVRANAVASSFTLNGPPNCLSLR